MSSKANNDSCSPILPRKAPVQNRSQIRFARILEVANQLIVDQGVDLVSMKDISLTAEISIASLYQYFPEKAAIIATLAHKYNIEGEQCVEEIISNIQKPADVTPALYAIIDSYHDFFRKVPGSYAIWQATQADIRLYHIDEQHCEKVAQIIAHGLITADPQFSKKEALSHSLLLTILLAAIIRKIATFPPSDAKKFISLYKSTHLAPTIRTLFPKETSNQNIS